MMSTTTLTSLMLLLIIHKSLTRPADFSYTVNVIGESGDHVPISVDDGHADSVERRIEETGGSSVNNVAEAGGSIVDLHSDPVTIKSEDLLSETASIDKDASQTKEISYSSSKGDQGGEMSNYILEDRGTGQQSATIISSYTYPVGSKPTKPAEGAGNPPASSQDKPSGTQTSPDASTSSEKPSDPQDGESIPGLFGFSGAPTYPGSGISKPGPLLVGSAPVNPSNGFTMLHGLLSEFIRPLLGHNQGFPPVPAQIGSSLGPGGPFWGFGSSLENTPSFNLPGPFSFFQGHNAGFDLHPWNAPLVQVI